jgi:hypothetical protein
METMGYLMGQRRRLRLTCLSCGHKGVLEPLALSVTYGEDFTTTDLWRRATCPNCGARKPAITLSP